MRENIFKHPVSSQNELFDTILQTPNIRIERIVSYGQASPDEFWYDQDENEWVSILEGEATLNIEGEMVVLSKGEFINIPAHAKHRVESTSNPTIWLTVFYK